jgi:hypothetical protein
MSDTTPVIAARYRALIMRRSGSDRLRMACEMFDCARQLMIARIKADHPRLTDAELRVKIFERTYGSDFASDERARIAARLREGDKRSQVASSLTTEYPGPSAH